MRFLLISYWFFFVIIHGHSQNLVRNGGFENHLEFPHGLDPFKWGAIHYLTDWTWTGIGELDLCDTLLEKRTDKLFKRTSCCGNIINPHSGKGMVKIAYHESCPFGVSTGCTSYIKSRLSAPLMVGNIYEISMWVYFPSKWVEDSTIYQNIGLYLSLYPVDIDVHEMVDTDYFFADTIQTDGWIQIKHFVRALCPLKHLTIGAFRNKNFPTLFRHIDNLAVYFIDDVKVVEVSESALPPNILPTPFCNYFEKQKKQEDIAKVEEINLYFPTNEFILDDQNKEKLDNFFANKEGNKGRAFVITGYTDNEGNDNLRLSVDRAHEVRDYLKSKYNLEDHLLINYGLGVDSTGNNATEKGRQFNRRVTVQNSNITSLQALYRKGLDYVKNNQVPEAARTFKAWINLAPHDKKMEMLHDPRLIALHALPVWKFLRDEVKKAYRFYSKPWDAFFLDSMYFVDQRFRTYTPSGLSGYIEGVDNYTFSKEEWPKSESEFLRFASLTYDALSNYLADHPYPKISLVGRRQARSASYIIAHHPDTLILQKYLPIVEEYCLQGEAEWDCYAILFDKLQLFRGQPQHYGTQYTTKDKQITGLYKVDDIEKVNIRRRRMGLSPVLQHYYH